MITNPTPTQTPADTWRRRQQEHRDCYLRRVRVPSEAHADGEDNDVTQKLRDWQARVAAKVATVDRYNDDVTCYRCGAMSRTLVGGATWRWNGEHWEHRCSGLR